MVCSPPGSPPSGGSNPSGVPTGPTESEQVSEAYVYGTRQVAGVPVVEESTITKNSDVQVGWPTQVLCVGWTPPALCFWGVLL